MNERDEQRVIEALRELTGGLTVTEQDINTAAARLKIRLEPPSPRRRLVLLAAAVAAVLAVGLVISQTIDRDDAAPPAGTPPSPADSLRATLQADAYTLPSADFTAGATPTAQDLTGFWLLRAPYNSPMFVDGNGGWSMGTLTVPFGHGTSRLAADTWTRRLDDRGNCAPDAGLVGFSQPWRTALAPDGSLRAELTIDNTTCTAAEGREVWDRAGPGSPVADYLFATAQDADWQPASGPFSWEGLYLAPETGHLLDVTKDGSYRYYDTLTDPRLVAADRGELESARGRMTGSCAAGAFSGSLETAQLPGVDGYVIPHDAIRIATTTDSCASGIAEQGVWVNVF